MVPILDFSKLTSLVPVPCAHLFEKLGEITRRENLLAGRPYQNAGSQGAHEADDLGMFSNRWRSAFRPENLGLFQCCQIEIDPGCFIGGQGQQRRRRSGVFQDMFTQRQRLLRNMGDELVRGHGRGCRHHMEPEWDEGNLAFVGNRARTVPQISETEVFQYSTYLIGRALGYLSKSLPYHPVKENIQPVRTLIKNPFFGQLRICSVDHLFELFPCSIVHFLKTRIRGRIKGKSRESVGVVVKEITRSKNLTGSINRRVQTGPRNILHTTGLGRPPDIGKKLYVG